MKRTKYENSVLPSTDFERIYPLCNGKTDEEVYGENFNDYLRYAREA